MTDPVNLQRRNRHTFHKLSFLPYTLINFKPLYRAFFTLQTLKLDDLPLHAATMSNQDQETAAAAVLVQSEPMPADAQKVEELDFNKHKDKPITVEELMAGMTNMGFQASSIGEAVKIINDMVPTYPFIT